MFCNCVAQRGWRERVSKERMNRFSFLTLTCCHNLWAVTQRKQRQITSEMFSVYRARTTSQAELLRQVGLPERPWGRLWISWEINSPGGSCSRKGHLFHSHFKDQESESTMIFNSEACIGQNALNFIMSCSVLEKGLWIIKPCLIQNVTAQSEKNYEVN